ncbi:MAG: hypothetical protein M1833_001317 [Piccolia ochrophora]|nr:MAG: hypothetical protein M1833_001317 [Piccolia ochrophora]
MGSLSELDHPPNPNSALTAFIQSTEPPSSNSHTPHHTHLAAHVLHNLKYQHNWTDLRLHTHSPLSPSTPLPRPLVSGLPPQRIYLHPDDQIDLLQRREHDASKRPEPEWILPTHLKEKWTLRTFAEVFDSIALVPPGENEPTEIERDAAWTERRRQKRLLLATVNDDSTVVFYIIHDGIVKPRQN